MGLAGSSFVWNHLWLMCQVNVVTLCSNNTRTEVQGVNLEWEMLSLIFPCETVNGVDHRDKANGLWEMGVFRLAITDPIWTHSVQVHANIGNLICYWEHRQVAMYACSLIIENVHDADLRVQVHRCSTNTKPDVWILQCFSTNQHYESAHSNLK